MHSVIGNCAHDRAPLQRRSEISNLICWILNIYDEKKWWRFKIIFNTNLSQEQIFGYECIDRTANSRVTYIGWTRFKAKLYPNAIPRMLTCREFRTFCELDELNGKVQWHGEWHGERNREGGNGGKGRKDSGRNASRGRKGRNDWHLRNHLVTTERNFGFHFVLPSPALKRVCAHTCRTKIW